MNTHKNKHFKTVAVIKNAHTDNELKEMGERFVNSTEPLLTIQQVLEMQRKRHLQPA